MGQLGNHDLNSDSDSYLRYDPNGNLIGTYLDSTNKVGTKYVYDAWNRLVTIQRVEAASVTDTLAEYTYDGLGRRISWREDSDDDGDVDSNDDLIHLALDASGRVLNTYLAGSALDEPVERFLYHAASPAIGGAGVSSILLRERQEKWTDNPDDILEERHYYLPDGRGNVAAVVTSESVQVEQVTYDWRGMPFNHPRGDADGDGDVDNDDFPPSLLLSSSGCDIRRDVNLDGTCDAADRTIATNTTSGGYGVLSFQENGNRFGFQMLQQAKSMSLLVYFEIGYNAYDVSLGRRYGGGIFAQAACSMSRGDCLTCVRQLKQDVLVSHILRVVQQMQCLECRGIRIECSSGCGGYNDGGGWYPNSCTTILCFKQACSCEDLRYTLLHELMHAWNTCHDQWQDMRDCQTCMCNEFSANVFSGQCDDPTSSWRIGKTREQCLRDNIAYSCQWQCSDLELDLYWGLVSTSCYPRSPKPTSIPVATAERTSMLKHVFRENQ